MRSIKKILLAICVCMAVLMIAPSAVPYSFCSVTAEAATVKLNKKKATLYVGETLNLKVKGTKSKVKWSSNKKSVATVNSNGKVKAKKKGIAIITANVEGKKYKCKVTIKNTGTYTLNETKLNMAVGTSKSLKVSGTGITREKIKWTTSDSGVATVSDKGKVKAETTGIVTITAQIKTKKLKCKVTVTNPQLSSNDVIKTKGNTYQLYVHGTTGTVQWKSENTAIATVDSNGLVTATGYGETKIRAIVDGTTLKCDFETEPVARLNSMYYMSAIECYALADTVASTDSGKVSFTKVGDIAAVDYSAGETYPVFEGYWYDKDRYTCYTDIYLIGTSQTALVKSNHDAIYTRYYAKDGYGILRVWANTPSIGEITIELDGYTYKITFRSRECNFYSLSHYDKEPDDYYAKDSNTKSTMKNYSTSFIPSDLQEKFMGAVEDKLIAICVDLLFKVLFGI